MVFLRGPNSTHFCANCEMSFSHHYLSILLLAVRNGRKACPGRRSVLRANPDQSSDFCVLNVPLALHDRSAYDARAVRRISSRQGTAPFILRGCEIVAIESTPPVELRRS